MTHSPFDDPEHVQQSWTSQPVMLNLEPGFHAVDVDGEVMLGRFDDQMTATEVVHDAGAQVDLAPGECHRYAVLCVSSQHEVFTIPMVVERPNVDKA